MTVKDETQQDKNQEPQPEQVEEAFTTPEDDAHEEAVRELEEAERAAEEGDDDGAADKAETKEFEQVADEAAGDDKAAGGEDLDKPDDEKGKTVPLAVLKKERKERQTRERDLELRLARTEGQLEATKSNPTDTGEPEAPQQSVEEQIADLNAKADEAAAQVDEGELTFAQANKIVRETNEQIQTLKDRSAQQAQDSQPATLDVRIEENLVELEGKYPVIKTLGDEQMADFVNQAYQQAEEEGEPIRTGALETMRLHNMAAKAAHDHYAQFYKTDQPVTPSSEQPSPDGQPLGKEGLSPQAKARADKIDLAANHPPDINQIGSSAEGTLNDTQILAKMEGLSEEERIEFLDSMPGLAQRLGG